MMYDEEEEELTEEYMTSALPHTILEISTVDKFKHSYTLNEYEYNTLIKSLDPTEIPVYFIVGVTSMDGDTDLFQNDKIVLIQFKPVKGLK